MSESVLTTAGPARSVQLGPPPAAASRRPTHRLDRVVRRPPGFGGTLAATLLLCASLTPSLLPRPWPLQALVSGLSMATGYGAGAALGALVRRVRPALPAPGRRAWAGLVAVGGILVGVLLPLAESWQREVRDLVSAPAAAGNPVLMLAGALAVAAGLVLAARAVRLATRRLAGRLGRRLPRPVAVATAVAIMATGGYGLGYGIGFHGVVGALEHRAAAANRLLPGDPTPPTSRYLSGGPGSLVGWESLGGQGRAFIAGAVPVADLAEFHGGAVEPPIRVYVGRDSAPGPALRTRLAVRELARTGAFDRAVLAVIVTTGTGWVNPTVASSLEYLHGGDTALVAMQYSYLPSWVSFLAERRTAAEAATDLLTEVRAHVAGLPPDRRPRLAVYGESLGAYGAETAFGQLRDLVAGVDAALLAGPPHRSPIWRDVTRDRDPGSPMWRPEHRGGELVRFAQHGGDLPAGAPPPRLVYLQNASDPIVWWSPQLLYRAPDWLAGPTGPDVSGHMRWLPVVTFWQVTVDLIGSTGVPSGHGHSYRDSIPDAWAALLPPPDWGAADTARLRDRVL